MVQGGDSGALPAGARGTRRPGSPVQTAPRCEEAFLPYRHLAIRVLDLALRDVADPDSAPIDRESARAFFAGSGLLFHWCRVAALDPRRMVACARKLTTAQARSIGGEPHRTHIRHAKKGAM